MTAFDPKRTFERDSLLPSWVTEIYLTRLGNQPNAGTDYTAYQNSRRTANYTNPSAYART